MNEFIERLLLEVQMEALVREIQCHGPDVILDPYGNIVLPEDLAKRMAELSK